MLIGIKKLNIYCFKAKDNMIYEIYLQWSIYNYKNALGIVANSNQQFMQVTGHICKKKTL